MTSRRDVFSFFNNWIIVLNPECRIFNFDPFCRKNGILAKNPKLGFIWSNCLNWDFWSIGVIFSFLTKTDQWVRGRGSGPGGPGSRPPRTPAPEPPTPPRTGDGSRSRPHLTKHLQCPRRGLSRRMRLRMPRRPDITLSDPGLFSGRTRLQACP